MFNLYYLYSNTNWDINALIDINKRGGCTDGLPDDISLDNEAHPLCRAGHRMCSWGYDKNKNAQKYRCPLACGRVSECPFSPECKKSSYGRTVYIKNDSDLRFHPRIPRDSDQYKTIYNERSASERVNNRILNDYHLQELKIRGDDHFSFWTMIIGICIHLDAWYKMNNRAEHTPWTVLFWHKFEYKFYSGSFIQTTGIVSPFLGIPITCPVIIIYSRLYYIH